MIIVLDQDQIMNSFLFTAENTLDPDTKCEKTSIAISNGRYLPSLLYINTSYFGRDPIFEYFENLCNI